MANKKLISLVGPTATGKSSLAIALGTKFHLPIVNVDSLLFYSELNIGVAKPTLTEREAVPHYLIDVTTIDKPLNAKDYCQMTWPILDKLWERYPAILLVGGSGFYHRALLYGMFDSTTSSGEILAKSKQLYDRDGISPFIEILEKSDPISLQRLHPNDHYRIRRAVEHWWSTQTPFSAVMQDMENKKMTNPRWKEMGWQHLCLYLDQSKVQHQESIERRTQMMLNDGLIQEVITLLKIYTGKEKPLQSIGYKEVQSYLSGEISSQENLHAQIVISTRQLAKAQRTWFAKIDKIELTHSQALQQAELLISEFL